jgi:orotidine-5'-phosphate decarboxylase
MNGTASHGGRECVILALDHPSSDACFAFLDSINSFVPTGLGPLWVKVGLELFVASGPILLPRLHREGYRVFLDLKFHDIPNTVAGAIRSVLPLQPALLTIHAGGGSAMMRAAAEAVAGSDTRLLAVTVLTSLDAGQLSELGIAASPAEHVERLALLAQACGIDGLVSSAQEVSALRALMPKAMLVTPGIRPQGSATGDQNRVSTPSIALRAGASQLVVGRPVTTAADPATAWLTILDEVSKALTR